MKTRPPTLAIVLVASVLLVGVVAYYQGKVDSLRQENRNLRSELAGAESSGARRMVENRLGEYSSFNQEAGGVTVDVSGLANDLVAVEEQRSKLQEELDEVLKPLREDILSSTLRTTIRQGEVLVTGGYQKADGRYQFAVVEPTLETLPTGETAIHLSTRHFSMGTDAMLAVGLDSLQTTAGNTLQHGEAWESGEMEKVTQELLAYNDVDLLTAPKALVVPGEQVEVMVGDYKMRTTPDITEDGSGFDIELRVEQSRAGSAEAQ